jgi:hypothetical protein
VGVALVALGCVEQFGDFGRGRRDAGVVGVDAEVLEELAEHVFDAGELLVGGAGEGGAGFAHEVDELAAADGEFVGELGEVSVGEGGALFPAAPGALVDADEVCGLPLGERRVVFLAEALEALGDRFGGSRQVGVKLIRLPEDCREALSGR